MGKGLSSPRMPGLWVAAVDAVGFRGGGLLRYVDLPPDNWIGIARDVAPALAQPDVVFYLGPGPGGAPGPGFT